MSIERLTHAHLEPYKQLRLLGLKTDPEAFHLTYQKALEMEDGFFARELGADLPSPYGFYGFFLDGILIGMISLQPIDKSKAQLYTFYVKPAMRGQGYGKQLLQHVIKNATDSHLESVCLDVTIGSQAIRMYQSLGFSPYESDGAELTLCLTLN